MTRQSANGHRPAAPADWDRPQPAEGTPLLRCRCGAVWTDDDDGRHAHRVVFSHQPRPREPARPPQEDT
jgi:hypothetical protein